jgi:type IV pilus assembly protein PilC
MMTSMTDESVETPAGNQASDKNSRFQALANLELTPKKIKRRELMHFSRQMAVFIKAGIPIIDALETISGEVKNKFFKQVLDEAAASLHGGSTFAGAFEPHAKAFPPYYMGILRSAELTGQLDFALDQLADYVDRDVEARRKIVSALTYPMIVAAMAVVVVVILVAFVLPRFKHFFSDLGAKLPLPTRMLLSFTDFTQDYWWLFAILAALLFALGLWLTQTDSGRLLRDRVVLRTPALGDLVQTAVLERFCRILSSMTSSGVPLTEALDVTAQSTSNVVYRNGIAQAREAMMRGEGLAAPLGETGLFPAAARQMLRVGEDTGTMDEQLGTAADYFARDLDYKIKRFTNLFEPAVILFVGIVVGFVAIALVSAMYGIFHQVHP